jgi:hypothetical protein
MNEWHLLKEFLGTLLVFYREHPQPAGAPGVLLRIEVAVEAGAVGRLPGLVERVLVGVVAEG